MFEEPKGLPPVRKFDHRIPLKLGAQPINFRLYKSFFVYKEEIEKASKGNDKKRNNPIECESFYFTYVVGKEK